mmetsp:Transcript_73346/g.203546  ORF Transcript_73346/g.203546 Transcript_73346/m.203546 type:complete len:461 (-) Transcript_73346:26-1408(-)
MPTLSQSSDKSELYEGVESVDSISGSGLALWQRLALSLLAIVALGCLHGLLYHLHTILVPFVLSGFIVLALQPAVEFTYEQLAGIRPPYRWCMCCCLRRRHEDADENDPLLASLTPIDQGRFSVDTMSSMFTSRSSRGLCNHVLDGLCRILAVSLVLSVLLCIVVAICVVLGRGAMHMKEDWQSYRAGYMRLGKRLDETIDAVAKELKVSKKVDEHIKEAYNNVLTKAQGVLLDVVNTILSELSGGFSTCAIMLLYILFWLLEPLPTGGKAGALVRSYIYKKTFVSFLYGTCVTVLFIALGIDLAALFGMIAFFLNFLPEVGAIISIVFPVPVILLDGRIENPFQVLIASIVAQLFLKFVFGNILEVKLIERDKSMSIHPVWVVLGLCYFGFVWGPTGMLISVPILALVKTAAVSVRTALPHDQEDDMLTFAESFLTCFEGRHRRHSASVQAPLRAEMPP